MSVFSLDKSGVGYNNEIMKKNTVCAEDMKRMYCYFTARCVKLFLGCKVLCITPILQ